MASRTPILMLIAIVVLGIYVLPSVTARFAGSHTMEINTTARVQGLMCERCHTYIIDELGATPESTDVLTAHRTAATNADYINDTGILNITATDGLDDVNRSACLLCHLVTRDIGFINQTHTHVTIRACTDSRCHGWDGAQAGSTQWNSTKLNITTKLNMDEDPHSKFYKPLDSATSFYTGQDGTNYTRGFYACLSCHTHVGLSFNLSRPVGFGFNFTAQIEGNENMTGFQFENQYINTSRNITVSIKQAGLSIWD